MMFEEYEGSSGAVELHVDMMNPFNAFELVKEPSLENLIKTAYIPSMAFLGYYGASALVGEAAPGFWVRQAISYEATKSVVQAGARFVPTAAVVSVPIAVSVVGAITYEKMVNEPLRDAHYSTQGTWFGPFASGFGSVV